MKKIILLIFMIVLFSPNVYAAEFNMNSYTSATNGGTKNRYRATEIYNSGTSNVYTFGTRYNGRISDIETYFDYPFVENTTYRLTYNMATDDFRNNFDGAYWWDCDDSTQVNPYRVSVSYISYKKIQVSFRPSANTTCIRIWVKSSNLSSVAITGVSNWSLTNITIYDPDWQSGSSGGQGTTTPTPTPTTGTNNQDIINSNNQNTEDIINSNNQNTQDIIENNNDNTNKIVDAIENKCSNLINHKVTSILSGVSQSNLTISDNSITFKGNTTSTSSNYVGYYIDVVQSTDYYLSVSNNPNLIYVFNPSYNVIAVLQNGQTSITFNSSSNDRIYILFYSKGLNNTTYSNIMLSLENKPYCAFGSSSNKLDNLNDSITNDNVDSDTGSDFFNNFDDEDFGLSDIITIPLTTIQGLTSKTCTALSVPIPFTNSNINLPCMTEIYQNKFPSIYNLWKIVSFGIIAYFIATDIFYLVKGFKDPESDKVEVLDL